MKRLAMKLLSHTRNDVLGGLVSAAVAIPLAMGYGMFAFASLGEDYFACGGCEPPTGPSTNSRHEGRAA